MRVETLLGYVILLGAAFFFAVWRFFPLTMVEKTFYFGISLGFTLIGTFLVLQDKPPLVRNDFHYAGASSVVALSSNGDVMESSLAYSPSETQDVTIHKTFGEVNPQQTGAKYARPKNKMKKGVSPA